MHFPALRQQFKPLPESEKAHYSAAYLVGGLLSVDRTFRRISTLITCFGFAARCRGLQSPTLANPSRYKVRIVSLTPWGEPTSVTSSTSCSDTSAGSEFGQSKSFSSGTNSCDILCSPDFGFSRKTQKSSRPAFQDTAGRPQRMLRYSVSLQTGCRSLAVMLSIAVGAALGSATRFLGDAGCLLYKQSNLTLKSVAANGGLRQSILDFRFWILDWRLEIGDF